MNFFTLTLYNSIGAEMTLLRLLAFIYIFLYDFQVKYMPTLKKKRKENMRRYSQDRFLRRRWCYQKTNDSYSGSHRPKSLHLKAPTQSVLVTFGGRGVIVEGYSLDSAVR